MVKASDVKTKPMRWLWKDVLPSGKIVLLAGDPGLGKSYLTCELAAIIKTVVDDNVALPPGSDDTLDLANDLDGDGSDPDGERRARETFVQDNQDLVTLIEQLTRNDATLADQVAALANTAPVAVDDFFRVPVGQQLAVALALPLAACPTSPLAGTTTTPTATR